MPGMLRVRSEVGRLRRVLLHEPGPEVDRMVPAMMEELLFDDILFGDSARDEHRRLRRLLQLLGVEVLDARDLLGEALEDGDARASLLELLATEVPLRARRSLAGLPPGELAEVLVAGRRHGPSPEGVAPGDLFDVTPLPNWCFQRDPQVVLGSGTVFSAMATPARWREGLLARTVFRFHPELAGAEILLDPLRPDPARPPMLGLHRPRLEGGDLLVISPQVVAVGLSERTNEIGVELLAAALARREDGPRWLEVVHLPARRAYMHLDTVFTPADRDAALVFPQVVLADGHESARVYEVDLHGDDLTPAHRGDLLAVLADRGVDLEPIPCGGSDLMDQQREQWTDGANTFALAPGVVTLYDRNLATADALADAGWRVVHADDVLLGREEVDLEEPGRVCLLLPSHELSRARGGPHCLTHPLERDDLA